MSFINQLLNNISFPPLFDYIFLFCSFNDDDSNLFLMTNSMRKENFEDIQEEHRKILETIESALHKLNSVRKI